MMILETNGVTKRFGGITANDTVNFSVSKGDIHGIIGPNGAGKSTFFNVLSGFYPPDEGTVHFDGENITSRDPYQIAQRGLLRTFQITSPFEGLSVTDNLLAAYTADLTVQDEKRKRADELLRLLNLSDQSDQMAGDLSGGQQKLLELGRVLMLDPKCMLLDEPTAGVNPALQDNILEYLQKQNDAGTTIVIIEHDMKVISEVTDRVTVLNNGQIVSEGRFEEIKEDTRVEEAYLGSETVEHKPAVAGTRSTNQDNTVDETRATERNQSHLLGKSLRCGYGNHTVLDDVTVRSRDGVTCIFGPNGSGKSTLIKTLNGVVPAWDGKVTFGGRDISDTEAHDRVKLGVVTLPQHGGVFHKLTVEENLRLCEHGVEEMDVESRLANMYETFPDLDKRRSAKARNLSGGQQTMLGFARAMMYDADIYLLDEPSAGLAPTLIDDVFDMIQLLTDQGGLVLLVEQNVRASLPIADYVYILSQGQIQFEGTPEDLAEEEELLSLYLGIK